MSSASIPGDPALSRGETPSPSPRAPVSLQAAAAVNAGLQHESSRRSSTSSLARSLHSPHSGRRRSQVLMNFQLNDPSIPGPGEMAYAGSGSEPHANGIQPASPQPAQALFSLPPTHSPQPLSHSPMLAGRDPHHNRTPSLGELHQELEAEQEAQVNRLLGMIRQQQLHLQQLQVQQSQSQASETAVADSSDRSAPSSAHAIPHSGSAPPSAPPLAGSYPRSPVFPHPRSSFDMARADLQRRSRTPSRGASPRMRATSIGGDSGDQWVLGGRDESAFYQAETQMLVRENQMLRHRVRDLEKQLAELNPVGPALNHEPSVHSHLTQSTSMSEGDGSASARARTVTAEPLATVQDALKEE